MPTYAELRAQDDRRRRRAAQDAHLVQRHRAFDLSAQDRHMKYERAHFAVVTASASFRAGWERIFQSGR